MPSALKVLTGSHHPVNKEDPTSRLPAELPDPPEWLDEKAIEEWVELTTLMSAVHGWLTRVNKTTLAGHCHWYSVWVAAEEVLLKEGRYYQQIIGEDEETGTSAVVKKLHPLVKVSKDAWANMLKCDQELGITPARGSSTRVPFDDPNDEEGLDQPSRSA